MKKIFFLVLAFFLAFGCVEEKPEGIQPFIEINDLRQEDTSKLILEIDSSAFSEKNRIEVLDSEGELICIDYIDLKEGFNSVLLECTPTKRNILVLVTPSKGETFSREFSIDLNLKKLAYPKKGLLYEFEWVIAFFEEKVDYEVYIVSSNDSSIEGIIVSNYPEGILEEFNEESVTLFSRFLFDRNTSFIYIAGPVEKEEALSEELEFTDSFTDLQGEILFPFFLSYLSTRESFKINSFLEEGTFSYERGGAPCVLVAGEECAFDGFECIELNSFYENEKILEAKTALEEPWMTFYIDAPVGLFELKNVEEKEFDLSEFK